MYVQLNSVMRSANIKLICNYDLDVKGVLVSVTKDVTCVTSLVIETPYACAIDDVTAGFYLFLICFSVTAYVMGGMYYNYK